MQTVEGKKCTKEILLGLIPFSPGKHNDVDYSAGHYLSIEPLVLQEEQKKPIEEQQFECQTALDGKEEEESTEPQVIQKREFVKRELMAQPSCSHNSRNHANICANCFQERFSKLLQGYLIVLFSFF